MVGIGKKVRNDERQTWTRENHPLEAGQGAAFKSNPGEKCSTNFPQASEFPEGKRSALRFVQR